MAHVDPGPDGRKMNQTSFKWNLMADGKKLNIVLTVLLIYLQLNYVFNKIINNAGQKIDTSKQKC